MEEGVEIMKIFNFHNSDRFAFRPASPVRMLRRKTGFACETASVTWRGFYDFDY